MKRVANTQWFALVVAIVLGLIILAWPSGECQAEQSARSLGMGGAHIGLASGVDAAKYNPANLGIAQFRRSGIELASVAASLTNNSFSLADYNKYTGAFLTDSDKDDILSKVPKEGLELDADVNANVMSLAMGSLVLGVAGEGGADITLNKDVLELILNGNTFADTITLDGTGAESVSYLAAFASYGARLYKSGSRELAVGVTAKYLYGLAMERMVEAQGLAATYADGFQGEGRAVIQTATGGSGYAVDLGATLKLNDHYTLGASVKNVVSAFTWNKDTEEHGYIFSFDTMTADNMDEDYVTSDDYTNEIDDISADLPTVITAGFARTSGSLLWAVDVEQGLRNDALASTTPRLSVGVELNLIGFIPLRGGFATGGDRNTAFAVGSGLHFPIWYIDYGLVTGSGLSGYSAKGADFAFSTGFYF